MHPFPAKHLKVAPLPSPMDSDTPAAQSNLELVLVCTLLHHQVSLDRLFAIVVQAIGGSVVPEKAGEAVQIEHAQTVRQAHQPTFACVICMPILMQLLE